MEKIKGFMASDTGKDILVVLIVILVGLGSFELGRLSNKGQSTGVKVTYPDGQEASALSPINALGQVSSQNIGIDSLDSNKAFFASTKGTKYYSIGCGAGKTIKQENRIYFETSNVAEAAGYTLSTSCK
jgi:hypothetical protein